MNIHELTQEFYEDSNGFITCVRLNPYESDGMRFHSTNELEFDLECDDLRSGNKRLHLTVTCRGVVNFDLSAGYVESIHLYSSHPLLLSHQGAQGGLYFSTAPQNPEQIFYDVCDIVNGIYGKWAQPRELIERSPAAFRSVIEGGFGLLARGPMEVLQKIQQSIGTAMKTQLIPSHNASSTASALIVDDHFVLCESVEVVQRSLQGSAAA